MILIKNLMEDIVRNPGLQHIIEKSLTLLNIKEIASVKSVSQDFRKIVNCPRFYLMKLCQQAIVSKDLIQKWKKLIPKLNDEDVEEDLKCELLKMNYLKNPKHPLQLAYDLSDEKNKLELAIFIIENSDQTDYVEAKEGFIGNLAPMHLAAMFGYVDAVTRMITNNSNDPNPSDVHGITPLLLAAEYGHVNIVQLLMKLTENPNAPRNTGFTPIHSAAIYGHLEVVRLLMTATTNPNTPDKEGWTPIHCAAKEGNLEILRLLMTSTGNPNAPGNYGWTSIHISAWKGHLDIIRLLMTSTDANPNVRTIYGQTPADIARRCGHLEVEEELKKFEQANSNN